VPLIRRYVGYELVAGGLGYWLVAGVTVPYVIDKGYVFVFV
jgi:hypothetical protein